MDNKNAVIAGLVTMIPVSFVAGLFTCGVGVRLVITKKLERLSRMLNEAVDEVIKGIQEATTPEELEAAQEAFNEKMAFIGLASSDTYLFLKKGPK